MPPCACLIWALVFVALRKHKVPPLRFAPVGMTELWREGMAQAEREEFSGGGEMDASRRADAELPTSRAQNAREMGHAAPAPCKKPQRWASRAMNSQEVSARMDRTTQRKAAQMWAAFSLIAHGSACHFVTRKSTLLLSTFLGVVTSIVPVVAPAGTVVVIAVPELLTANVG